MSVQKGRITSVAQREQQPRFAEPGELRVSPHRCTKCGKSFSHPPALVIHEKFCSGQARSSGAQQGSPSSATAGETQPVLTSTVRVEEVGGEQGTVAADEGRADEGGVPIRSGKRRLDGGLKQSGLREGQRRIPHSLYFKYQVALEFSAMQRKKELGIIANPLQKTSQERTCDECAIHV